MSDPGKAVFLSYASQDAEAAKRICEALRAAGVEVWFDQSELVGGDAWDQKIRRQIKECALLIPIISAATQARTEGYFRLEWRLADQRTHLMAKGRAFLLPVVIDDTRDSDAHVPDSFTEVQWTRLPGGEAAPAFAQRVKKLLEGGPGSRATASRPPAPASPEPSPPTQKSRPWLFPVIFGAVAVAIATVWLTRPPALVPVPSAVPPAPTGASVELARLRARIVPDRWQKGDFETVSPALDRLIQADPENADAWALSSIIHSLQVLRILDPGTKPLEAGKAAAERALRLAPDSPLPNLALGMHLIAMVSRGGDPAACREPMDRALRALPPDDLTRYAGLASVWLGYDFEGTERRAREWLEAEPGASYPVWILGGENLAKRRLADALKWGEQAAADPNITGVRALSTLSDVHFYLRADLKAMRATLDRVPVRARTIARVVYNRWLLAMAEQRWDEALQELSQVPDPFLFDLGYNGPKALLAGLAHQRAGRPEAAGTQFREAERLLRERLAVDTDNEALRAVLALTLASAGRAAEARSELGLVEPLVRGRAPNVYRMRLVVSFAQAYGALGDFANMAAWLRKLLAEPSGVALTPASLRLDPRFSGALNAPEIQALLKEFAALDQPVAPKTADAGQGTEAGAPVDRKSVAVLAFANRSDDRANEYFSDGISEELLNVLAKVPGLKVSARTSAFYFKGKEVPIPEIAKQLGVAYVVEGSVRKQGDKVRISAQLIKAADGFPVWSDTFTRDLRDIFAVQDEIAGLIAQQLQLKLGGTARPAPPINPEAFELYVQARRAWNLRNAAGFAQAEELLTRALLLEPDFARAHVALADVWTLRALANGVIDTFGQRTAPVFTQIAGEIQKALALDPDSSEARASWGLIVRLQQWDLSAAERELRRAVELNPNYATAHHWLGNCLSESGRIDEGLAELRRAAELDPFSLRILESYAKGLVRAGRQEEALAVLGRAETLQARAPLTLFTKAEALLQLGRRAEAIATARELDDTDRAELLARAGEKAEAEAALGEAEGWSRYQLLAALGRTAEALAALRAEEVPVTDVESWLMDPRLDPFRQDRHFVELLATLGLTEAHARMQSWRAAHPGQ